MEHILSMSLLGELRGYEAIIQLFIAILQWRTFSYSTNYNCHHCCFRQTSHNSFKRRRKMPYFKTWTLLGNRQNIISFPGSSNFIWNQQQYILFWINFGSSTNLVDSVLIQNNNNSVNLQGIKDYFQILIAFYDYVT